MYMENILQQRVGVLAREYPDRKFACYIASSEVGDWGYIELRNRDDKIIGYEFVESIGSWERSEAFRMHETVRDQGYNVRILVPEFVFREAGTKAFLQGAMQKVDMDTLEGSGVVLEIVPPRPFNPNEWSIEKVARPTR